MNEELQSTNEELETSKEELQSVNEELATVNSELQNKVADLSRANNDMNNLLAGTGIATVFVDNRLRIMRFTPGTTHVINMILSDVGRPISHIVSNLKDYDRLVADVQSVLDTLIPKEEEVQSLDGNWYTMRIQPYRTIYNVIEGAVLTFVDITDRKKVEDTRHDLDQKYRTLHEGLPNAHVVGEITGNNCDTRFVECNQAALSLLGMSREQLLATDLVSLSPERQPDGRLSREKARALNTQCMAQGNLRFDWQICRGKGRTFSVEITMIVYHEQGKTFLHSVWRDLTGLTHKSPPESSTQSKKRGKRP